VTFEREFARIEVGGGRWSRKPLEDDVTFHLVVERQTSLVGSAERSSVFGCAPTSRQRCRWRRGGCLGRTTASIGFVGASRFPKTLTSKLSL
jgi:hypothetical protein